VNLGGLRFGALTAAERDRVLAEARAAELSYGPPVGHTLDLDRPMVGESIEVASFDAAKRALQTWVAHRGVGFEIVPPDAPVEVGTTLLVVVRWGPFHVLARNRIVAVVDEPRRFAWAYGTVDGHPEQGEEAFLVEQLDDGTVRLTIRTESGPASWSAKLVAPLVHRWQIAALRGYLRAIAVACRS
jgi:uncharacterized protein (UPF0548 family)